VVTRYITAQAAAWASELATLAFAWLVFFGASACIKYRLHPSIDMLVRRLPVHCSSVCAGSITRCCSAFSSS
jgi:TRAP-type C4-dicarboxylate transport system permease small subunit